MRIKKPVSPASDYPALWLVFLYRALANFKIRFWRAVLYGRVPRDPDRILIFRTGSLGDSICALPAIAQIKKRYPEAEIDILTSAGASNLVSMPKLLHPGWYNNIIDYFGSSVPAQAEKIKARKYDLLIELPQYDVGILVLLRNMVFFRFKTKIKNAFGWQLDTVPFFKKAQNRNIVFTDERNRLLQIVNRYTGQTGMPLEFPLAIVNNDVTVVEQWIQQNGIDQSKPVIAMVPGAKRQANTWPKENFKTLVDHFAPNYQIVFCGGMNEKELAQSLTGNDKNVWNACGAFTPVQTSVFFGQCSLVITNDTGPLHLAYAAATPTISLFSTRDYANRWFPPQNDSNKVFRAGNVDCSPCFLENCPYDNKCLRTITADEVIQAAEGFMKDL